MVVRLHTRAEITYFPGSAADVRLPPGSAILFVKNRYYIMVLLKRSALAFVFLGAALASKAQVTGGQFAMEFLRLPQSPHISALGGMTVSNPSNDISLTMQNPALMRPGLHNELSLNYNAYYADISVANLAYGYHMDKIKTSFAFGVQYLNYGSFMKTDQIGNMYGNVNAREYALTLAASRQYGERWRYGASLKWAQSYLGDYNAAALLADVGIVYTDTANLLSIGVTAKNMGAMLFKYNTSSPAEQMPFDLQIGISKRFAHLPLRVFTTIHHLYEWDIRYNNPADIETGSVFGTQDTTSGSKGKFGDKLFRHFIFGGELLIGKRITATVAYNHLRRGELGLKDKQGLAGFSFGAGINLNKFQISYARSYYHITGAYNEFGLNLSLNKLVNLGKSGEKINWNTKYEDWDM